MIKMGDRVLISPHHCLAFPGMCGTVVKIRPKEELSIGLKIDNKSKIYYFDPIELIGKEEVKYWDSLGEVHCSKCGKDITGKYSNLCEDCKY